MPGAHPLRRRRRHLSQGVRGLILPQALPRRRRRRPPVVSMVFFLYIENSEYHLKPLT
jgi:hypothetical protein